MKVFQELLMSLIQSLLPISKITKVGAKVSLLGNACLWNLLFDCIQIKCHSLIINVLDILHKSLIRILNHGWFCCSYLGAVPCACCIGSFSHQLSECILNAKATSHMAPTQESAGQRSNPCFLMKMSFLSQLIFVWVVVHQASLVSRGLMQLVNCPFFLFIYFQFCPGVRPQQNERVKCGILTLRASIIFFSSGPC